MSEHTAWSSASAGQDGVFSLEFRRLSKQFYSFDKYSCMYDSLGFLPVLEKADFREFYVR